MNPEQFDDLPYNPEEWETPCPKREDKVHCDCWYDGEMCCACGDPKIYDDYYGEQNLFTS